MWDFLRPKIIPFLIGILFVNILFINYHVFFRSSKPLVQNINLSSIPSSQNKNSEIKSDMLENQSVQTEPSQTISNSNTCSPSCLDAIRAATASLNLNPTIIITQAPAQTTQITTVQSPREYFIPFGSASGASQGTWSSLPGLSAYVNTNNYSNITSITFEVSAHIPNGNQSISIQLYNATDGTVIPNSVVSMSGGTPQLLISPNISLPSGNKLYQVQINTQLNDSINIDQARLHITTN